MNIIEIKNLHKSFGEVKAVDGISFSVKEGELKSRFNDYGHYDGLRAS